MYSRRLFLKGPALAVFGIGAAPGWLNRAAAGTTAGRRKVLVTIFQRGAADGMNILVPHGEAAYYTLRPSIAIPHSGENAVIKLDGHFGLHPSLAALKPLYDNKSLAIVEAVGSPDPTRSHFDAQDYMESGTPGRKATADGWLNRALPRADAGETPVRAVAMGPTLPRSLRGPIPAVAISNLRDFQVRNAAAARSFEQMYTQSADRTFQSAGTGTFEATKLLDSLERTPYTPSAPYPSGRFPQSLQQIARLIKADVGVEVAFADIGGWDHHVNETNLLNIVLRQFGDSLAAFAADLGDRMADVVLVTMSEFGRTARENGSRGTDHGHANVMFVLGGPVKGGKVYGDWPGLAEEQLHEGRDLALTTDFRDVLAELVDRHSGNHELQRVFPGYAVDRSKYRHLL